MTKYLLIGSAALLSLATVSPASAQDAEEPDTPETTDETNGAIVTREATTEEVAVLDENGDPVLDEEGNPVMETVTIGFVQTVETPSGNFHTITKPDGGPAVVEHEFAERPEKPERAERAERPERPEKPEKPSRPDRPNG